MDKAIGKEPEVNEMIVKNVREQERKFEAVYQ